MLNTCSRQRQELLVAFQYYICFISAIPIGITSAAVGIKTCVITVGIKKYKSIIKKKKTKYGKIVFLRKDKWNTIEVRISKALIDLHISHDEFVSINNVLREYFWNEKRNKKSWNLCGIYYIKTMETYCVSYKKNTANKNSSVRKTKENRLMLLS